MSSGKSRDQDRLWRLVILGSCILIFIVSTLYGLLHGFDDPAQSWAGYFTLTVDRSAPLPAVDRALAAAGVSGVLSADGALVGVSDFTGVGYRRLDELRAAAEAGDPRADGFVRDAAKLFVDAGGRNHVLYLPARAGLAPLMLQLSRALDPLGCRWRLLEWRPLERICLVAAAAAAALLLVAFSPKRRLLTLASLLPWLPLAASGGPTFFPLHAAMLLTWALLLETLVPALKRYAHDVRHAPFFWDKPTDPAAARESLAALRPYLDQPVLRVRLAAYGAAVALFALCAVGRGNGDLVPGVLLVQFMAWPALLALLARLYQVRHRRAEHQLFAPIPILTRGRALHSRLRPALLPLAALALAVPLGFGLLAGAAPAAQVPVPAGRQWGGLGWGALEAEQSAPERGALPSVGDYVRHRAFQEALPWLKDYRWSAFALPAAGDSYSLDRYRADGTAVKLDREQKIAFGDAWLFRVRAGLPEASLDRLYLSQGRVSGLVFSQSGKLYSADVWSLPALVGLLCFTVPLLVWGRKAGFRQIYGTRRVPSGSRKLAA